MNHTITIKNLGPLKDIENFEVRDINLIIGENASGKSVLATAIFFFNEFFDMLQIEPDSSVESIGQQMIADAEATFVPYNQYHIKYNFSQDSYIEIDTYGSKETTQLIFSDEFEEELKKTIKEITDAHKSRQVALTAEGFEKMLEEIESDSKYNIDINEIRKLARANVRTPFKIYQKFVDAFEIPKTYFIPAVRSAYLSPSRFGASSGLLLQSYSERYMRKEMEEDSKLINFLYLYSKAHEEFTPVPDEYKKIMKGDFISNGDGVKFITHKGGQQLDMNYLSSGQKAAIPILLILNYLTQLNKKCLLIIEEPEANIFPTAQREIFDEIVKFANVTGSKILIMTHSPYMVLSANNLLEAHGAGLEKYENKTIDLKKLNASKLEDGKFESLIDDEYELISSEYLENITEVIMNDFDEIIEAKTSEGLSISGHTQ